MRLTVEVPTPTRQRHSPGVKEEDAPEQPFRAKLNYAIENLPTAMHEIAAPVVILKPVLALVALMPS